MTLGKGLRRGNLKPTSSRSSVIVDVLRVGDTTMSVKDQQALDRLYAIDNVLTIEITMPQADWDKVRTEQPAGGVCNFDWAGDSRYTWHKAASVKISGTSFPAAAT